MQVFRGSLLAARRRAAGYSRERLGVAAGRSLGSIAEYEKGRLSPPGDVLGVMASALGCTVDDFFEVDEIEVGA
jgi:transcriptional regulator with XRE-family HTH domain